MIVPCLLEDNTFTFPLWYSSTIRFTKERPNPQPRFLEVTPD